MNFDFYAHVLGKLTIISDELKRNHLIPNEIEVQVADEQIYAKMDEFNPDTIYVVIKYLSSDIQFEAESLPVQLIVLTEQNSITSAKLILDKFASENNWQVIIQDSTYVKQQYNSPVILNNFVEVTHGYRSTLYLSGMLFIMNNVVDVRNLTINNESITNLISCSIAYNMQTNSQQTQSQSIARSVKTVSSFALTVVVPMLESSLIKSVAKILGELEDGNERFTVSFKLGDLTDTIDNETVDIATITKSMKLTAATITTAINQVPSIQLGFIK